MAVWGAAEYARAYRRWVPVGNGWITQSYGRAWYEAEPQQWAQRVHALQARNVTTPSSHQLIVGCGFGYLIHYAMVNFNASNLWGTDISPYIQANKATEAPSTAVADRILNIDILQAGARQALQAAGAGYQTGPSTARGTFDLIVTEHVMEGYSTSGEVVAMMQACEGLKRSSNGIVCHFVITPVQTTRQVDDTTVETVVLFDPDLWGRTAEEWLSENAAAGLSHFWFVVNEWTADGEMRVLGGPG